MMFDIQTISIVIAAATVVAGVIYSSLQVGEQTKMRQTDLIMRLYATYSSGEFQDAWEKVRNSHLEDFKDIYDYGKKHGLKEINQVCLFFEGIGVLLHKKLVDVKMVDDLFGGAITREWERVREPVMLSRKQLDDPTAYYYFEYLYNEMKRIEQKSK
jgi:hypothetical protein